MNGRLALFPAVTHLAMAAGLGLQLLSAYAVWVTFGAWLFVAVYALGGLTVLLQYVAAHRRATSC
jgi:hypothetical protein